VLLSTRPKRPVAVHTSPVTHNPPNPLPCPAGDAAPGEPAAPQLRRSAAAPPALQQLLLPPGDCAPSTPAPSVPDSSAESFVGLWCPLLLPE
jgi:hypothetical protein